jgi:hypothetical protein
VIDELPFKVVRSNGTRRGSRSRRQPADCSRGLSGCRARLYPEDLIELRQGVRIIERNKS